MKGKPLPASGGVGLREWGGQAVWWQRGTSSWETDCGAGTIQVKPGIVLPTSHKPGGVLAANYTYTRMYICRCVCTCICVHTYVYTCTYTHAHKHVRLTHSYICIYVSVLVKATTVKASGWCHSTDCTENTDWCKELRASWRPEREAPGPPLSAGSVTELIMTPQV